MAYIILAAGKGVRANSDQLNIPKVLLKAKNGKSLLVNNLEKNDILSNDKKIHIVMGYLFEQVIREVETYQTAHIQQNIKLIHNDIYEQGVLTSLYRGIQDLNEDCVIMNGDTNYSPEVFNVINKLERSTLLVMPKMELHDSVKVLTDDEKILQVGKKLEDYTCLSIGCLFLKREHTRKMSVLLKELLSGGSVEHIIWHNLINMMIDRGENIYTRVISREGIYEIDTQEDYRIFLNA